MAAAAPPQQEQLPDAAPFPTFFLPNFLGILFAFGLETFKVEAMLRNFVSAKAHPYALLGLGLFGIANTNSYLGGSVVVARIQYGVKLPNLYATSKHKDGVAFNCIQRGHQNFLETYAQLVLSVLFVATLRPNIAGMMLIVVAIARVLYARGYRNNIPSRIGPLLVAMFTMSIGVGYGFLLGLTAFGIQMMDV
jgi:hypothetical protein